MKDILLTAAAFISFVSGMWFMLTWPIYQKHLEPFIKWGSYILGILSYFSGMALSAYHFSIW